MLILGRVMELFSGNLCITDSVLMFLKVLGVEDIQGWMTQHNTKPEVPKTQRYGASKLCRNTFVISKFLFKNTHDVSTGY